MGTDTIPARKQGQKPFISWINNFKDALCGVFVPRNANGIAEANSGRIGNASYKFSNLNIYCGHVNAGDVLPWYDYAGAVAIPQGFVLCDSSIINEANYDAQHSAGDWDKYIGTSVLDGLRALNLNGGHYPFCGANGLFGSYAGVFDYPDSTGYNVSSLHNHGAFNSGAAAGTANTLSVGSATRNVKDSSHVHAMSLSNDSVTVSIDPEHIEVKYILRII